MTYCSIKGCNGKHKARNLCGKHLSRFYVHGKTELPEKPPTRDKCIISECDGLGKLHTPTGKRYFVSGYCSKHYWRVKATGSISLSDKKLANRVICKSKPCNNICTKEIEYCQNCYYMNVTKKRKPLYSTWSSIKQRCENKDNKHYPYYGGRGIKVCKRWSDSYELFEKDVGKKPSPKHSLDRINNDGDYEPGNVRWADRTVQMLNRRKVSKTKSGVVGVLWDKRDKIWIAKIGVYGKSITIGYYRNLEDAILARKNKEKEVEKWIAKNIV